MSGYDSPEVNNSGPAVESNNPHTEEDTALTRCIACERFVPFDEVSLWEPIATPEGTQPVVGAVITFCPNCADDWMVMTDD